MQSYLDGIEHFERLFRLKPQAIAYDLHPDYMTTRYALARAEKDQLASIGVQHHHAHITACMADTNLPPGSRSLPTLSWRRLPQHRYRLLPELPE
jgi:hydrogenase maturation factor HypF (carbamoyltransferase family)